MKVAVKLFAAAREAAGASEVMVELADGSTVGELRAAIGEQWPALEALMTSSLIAVNAEYAPASVRVEAGDEVALIPPVSGG
jgi:molybdopterin converting factor subunit 1